MAGEGVGCSHGPRARARQIRASRRRRRVTAARKACKGPAFHNDRIAHILDDRYVKISTANAIADAANGQARFIRNTVISAAAKDADQNADAFKELATNAAATDEAIDQLDKLIVTPATRELFAAMMDKRAKFYADRDEVARLVKAGQTDDAVHTLLVTMRPTQRAFFASVAAIVKEQAAEMTIDGQQARDDGRSAVVTAIALAGVAASLAAVMAFVITRGLTRQLGAEPGEVVAIASAIAGGNLAVDVRTQPGDATSTSPQ